MLGKPFAQEQELKDKTARLDELTLKLSQGSSESEKPQENEATIEEKQPSNIKSNSVIEALHKKISIVQDYENHATSNTLAPVI
ncbi:hypothetical protein [Butyrivibrio sp. AC2005]|uniref:hypothetical protein n=1 Tax=Butyrivibrio sp. AC2005 TaxID=1280672 RepID=UPI000478D8BE|nr:hypothetical protein [Butyrivibrio sp. AC2005]